MTPAAALTLRRVIRATAVVFGAVTVAAAATYLLLPGSTPRLALVLASLPFIASALVTVTGVFLLLGHVRTALHGGNPSRIAAVVLRGRHHELDADDRAAAARYAPVAVASQTLFALVFSLVFPGVLLTNVSQMMSDEDFRMLFVATSVLIVIAAAITIPGMLRQARRAKRYAAAHPA